MYIGLSVGLQLFLRGLDLLTTSINYLMSASINQICYDFFYPTKKYGWGKKNHMIFIPQCMIFFTPSQYHNFVHMIVLIEDIALICY